MDFLGWGWVWVWCRGLEKGEGINPVQSTAALVIYIHIRKRACSAAPTHFLPLFLTFPTSSSMIARQSCKGGKHLFLVRAPSPTDIMQRLQQQQQQQSRTTNKTWPRSPIAEDSSLARQQLIVVSSSFHETIRQKDCSSLS
jgi:hypothetical protein